MLERYLDTLLFELQGADDFLMAIPSQARAEWDALPPDQLTLLRQRADAWLERGVPPLSASSYISFSRAGIAAEYAENWEARREMLCDLVLGTCASPDGRYDMKLCDVIWALCEESSWVLPRNNPINRGREGYPLPDVRHHRIDIGAARTAADLSLAVQMITPRLDSVSEQLIDRVEREIDERIVQPFSALSDWGWMCGPKADALRCLVGCALAVLTFTREDRVRWTATRKCWQLFDRLLESLPHDGSMPGGLDAWAGMAEPMMDMVMTILSASRGQVDARGEKQIQLLCHYPVFCHMAEGYFVNPGQHSMRPALDGRLLYRVGGYVGDNALCDLGACVYRAARGSAAPSSGSAEKWLLHRAADLFTQSELSTDPARPPFRRQGYYPAAQMMVARGEEDSEQGLAVAIHGGGNGDVGSHPDVGDFVLFSGGDPVLIDAGYLTDTEFHNLPVIDGKGQKLGAAYRAEDVVCRLEDAFSLISLNLAYAYPGEPGAASWQRSLIFERDDGVLRLIEMYDLPKPSRVDFNFITPHEPTLGPNWAQIGPVRMRWEKGLNAVCDALTVPEGEPRALWGEKLYRLSLSADGLTRQGKLTFLFNALRTFG